MNIAVMEARLQDDYQLLTEDEMSTDERTM